jgi:S-adenosylmethionine hydrolase
VSAPSGLVTLLTDFGIRDPFVGIMKGVMLSIARELRLVDLTHGIEPQAIGEAAFWLEQSYRWFPAGSVHVVVVDPGVGSERAAVAVRANGHYFVGPDNGSFEVVVRRAAAFEAREVVPERLGLSVPSRTFHGRDVFAPVGASLAAGQLAFDALGAPRALVATERVPEPIADEDGIRGVVVAMDRFGNLVTNIALSPRGGPAIRVECATRSVELVRTYADVAVGTLGAVVGSCGTVELFVRDGSARELLGAKRGLPVRVSATIHA